MDFIPVKTFYGGKVATKTYTLRDIPSGSEDSELSDDEVTEPNVERREGHDFQCFYDENHFTPEDDIPLSRYVTTSEKKNLKWNKSKTARVPQTFEGSESLPQNILELDSPYKLFSFFITRDFLTEVVRQSCLYSVQIQPDKPLTTQLEKIEHFLGVLLWMSLIRQPTTRRYWAPRTRISQIADVMPVNRFEKLKRFLHFSDNTEQTRSIDKILPVIHQIKSACGQIPLEEHLSCDEQVIPFKGRTSLKTYNPKKPHKWGYKMWVLSGVSGLSYNFELFAGKQGFDEIVNEPNLGAASNVVVRMSRIIPSSKHHKLFYDNYFSSLPLVSYLAQRKIHSVATVRANRLMGYKQQTEKDMKKMVEGILAKKRQLTMEQK